MSSPSSPKSEVPTVLASRYVLHREIGRGGMARVFLGWDTTTKSDVAIKILHPELVASTSAERFQREIAVLSRLQHPSIVTILDSRDEGQLLYFVMPYVSGETLRQCLNRTGALSVERAMEITIDLADAIDYAHAQNVVHRDIKPENVLLDDRRVLLCDFGIVRLLAPDVWGQLSSGGLFPGTVSYMSPEQILEPLQVGASSDVYALGCVVYEMLSGEAAFGGRTPQVIMAKHLSEEPRPIRTVRSEVSPALERVVMSALAKDWRQRPASALAFAHALAAA